jgi:hypothetical protein
LFKAVRIKNVSFARSLLRHVTNAKKVTNSKDPRASNATMITVWIARTTLLDASYVRMASELLRRLAKNARNKIVENVIKDTRSVMNARLDIV